MATKSKALEFQVSIANGKHWDGNNWSAPSDDYGQELVEQSPILTLYIDYPLRNPKTVVLRHRNGTGWTKSQFVEAVCAEYKKIYKEEGKDPGHVPGMLNRKASDGPHGIWGHGIGDLVLEGAEQGPDGIWDLMVGS